MDPAEEITANSRLEINVCRCCLSNCCSKYISEEYYYSGQREVYEDMLRDTFNIRIVPRDKTSKICEECIKKLREASTFKRDVLGNEAVFATYLMSHERNGGWTEIKTEETDLNIEKIKPEPLPMCDDDDHRSFDDDEFLANIKFEMTQENSMKHKPKRVLKPQTGTRRIKVITKQTVQDSNTDKDWAKILERRGNGPILRENSLKLLENSTICVFQWNKSRYRCFCCNEPFSEMKTLREHTKTRHTLKNIEKKIIFQQNRLVKVEVSILDCRICEAKFDSLNNLKKHLTDAHNLKFELNEDLLVPFKIDANLQCQICNEKFTVFRLLNIHMNKHYQKQVCHICGAGFSNLVFLNLHKTRSHRPLECKECNLVFKTRTDKKNHESSVHNVKFERRLRFPCPYCQERFFQENFRVLHLVEKHGMPKPEHKCLVCLKTFVTKSLCNNHMKNVHLKEKNHECDVCHNFFYTKSDVLRHRVTHTGEKKFSCSFCSNLFATKDSLRRHMKRTHVGMH